MDTSASTNGIQPPFRPEILRLRAVEDQNSGVKNTLDALDAEIRSLTALIDERRRQIAHQHRSVPQSNDSTPDGAELVALAEEVVSQCLRRQNLDDSVKIVPKLVSSTLQNQPLVTSKRHSAVQYLISEHLVSATPIDSTSVKVTLF